MNLQSAEDLWGGDSVLQGTGTVDLSPQTCVQTPGSEAQGDRGPWVVVTCPCRSVGCSKRRVWWEMLCTCGVGVPRGRLSRLLGFAVNLKLL